MPMYQELKMMTEHLGFQLRNNNLSQIKEDIRYATNLVFKLVIKELEFNDFLHKYNNFYYWIGFDELPQDEKEKLFLNFPIINIHRKIQEDIINKVYCSDYDIDILHSLGRISIKEAIDNIGKLFEENKVEFMKTLNL